MTFGASNNLRDGCKINMVSLSRVDSKVIELEFSAAPRSLHCSLGQKRCLCILESHVLAANAYTETVTLGATRNLHGPTLQRRASR